MAALLLPGLVLGFGLGLPLGWWSDYARSYHRIHGLVANPIGGPLVAVILSLVCWHGAHHLRHFALDLGMKRYEAPLAYTLYGLAALSTAACFAVVASL